MDPRSNERARPALHGLVTAARALALALAPLSLVGAVAGGLLRACTAPPPPTLPAWLTAAALAHAALMICGFLGTIVALERAVAVGQRNDRPGPRSTADSPREGESDLSPSSGWTRACERLAPERPSAAAAAFLAPLASGLGGALLLAGHARAGAWAMVAAAAAFVVVNIVLVRRQRAPHTWLLLAGAVAWLVGSALYAGGASGPVLLPWWFAFLVATIAAERLEMTRLTGRGPAVERSLRLVMATLFGGAAVAGFSAPMGAALFGTALVLLAAWLFLNDVARRTLFAHGLARYMAVCLLTGYGWLAAAGIGWIGLGAGLPLHDLALHALGLGFVVSMMMAHAPVILPAVARVKLRFGWPFYLPLAALHVSLVVRLGFGASDMLVRGLGAALNAASLALFAATIAGAILAWRLMRAGAEAARAGAKRPRAHPRPH